MQHNPKCEDNFTFGTSILILQMRVFISITHHLMFRALFAITQIKGGGGALKS